MTTETPIRTAAVITPALFYKDGAAAIEWLSRAFGFEKRFAFANEQGVVEHAEMSFGPGVIMLGTAGASSDWRSPRDLPGVSQTLSVYVADPDAHYARAKAAGAEIVQELEDKDYGARDYTARDLEGHYWTFGTYVVGSYWTNE